MCEYINCFLPERLKVTQQAGKCLLRIAQQNGAFAALLLSVLKS
jgi:hypothetical protein